MIFKRVLYSLDPDQAGHFVGPDLSPNCGHIDETRVMSKIVFYPIGSFHPDIHGKKNNTCQKCDFKVG